MGLFDTTTLLLRLIPEDLYIGCPHRQFHPLPVLLHNRVALLIPYPNAYVPSKEVVCTILQVFGMLLSGHEPTTYCMRGGRAYHFAIPTRSWMWSAALDNTALIYAYEYDRSFGGQCVHFSRFNSRSGFLVMR